MKRDYHAAQLAGPAERMRPHHNDHMGSAYQPYMSASPASSNKGKQLMSFQNYVRGLSNSVDENTACKKYKDFMANLSQSKVGRFFDANKDREWFKIKYHPVESQRTLHLQNENFIKRLKIFNDLNERNYFDTLSYTSANSPAVLNLLDAVIVLLEDGPQDLAEQLLSRDDVKINQELRQRYVPSKPISVVIDDISIETTLAEIHEVCSKASPDLLRIAQLDPHYVEGGQLRRKVVAIYKDHVDIKDVCWKLSRTKLNNRLINVCINKCLKNRVSSVGPLSNHQFCVVNDIRNAIILILNFDELKGLYGKRKQLLESGVQESNNVAVKMEDSISGGNVDTLDNVAPLSPPGSEKSANEEDESKPFDVGSLDEEKEKEKRKLYEFKFNTDPSLYRLVSKLGKSKNPLLERAYVYLVEFVNSSAAKYYLSKIPAANQAEPVKDDIDQSITDKYSVIGQIVENLAYTLEESTKYLDKLLWYLRIVHSFDYYKKLIYKQEDELTLRMSFIHLRGDPVQMGPNSDETAIKAYLKQSDHDFDEFGLSQAQKYVTKDEERFNYKSYGKVITDELASYAQRIQRPKSNETEEVYKCKHCTRVFQKLSDIGRHFVSKHRWAVDAIELETDFFNAYLFDSAKINPVPPTELLEVPPNRFSKLTNFSQMGEDPDLLQQTIEAYNKLDSFVREPAPRAQCESDPRNDSIVDYTDISFDDAI